MCISYIRALNAITQFERVHIVLKTSLDRIAVTVKIISYHYYFSLGSYKDVREVYLISKSNEKKKKNQIIIK